MVFFWTDILIYLLVSVAVVFFVYARRHEHLRGPWREVGRSGVAMGALVVLSFYIVIGLLDSIHFHPKLNVTGAEERTSNKVVSVFDMLVGQLRLQRERTYSAPFATHAYSRETVERDGRTVREYPKLAYGGAHLTSPEQRGTDILMRTAIGLVKGVAVWLLLVVALSLWRMRRQNSSWHATVKELFGGATRVRWRSALYSLLVMVVLTFIFIELASKYHVFGTDKVGEDVFYQSLKSIRTGLVIGTLTTLIMLPFAVLLGIMAGYFGGWADDVIQYLYTTLNSIPGVLLIAAAILMLQVYLDNHSADFNSLEERADLRLLFLCLILGVTSWTGLCRYLRGESLKLREIDYIQSAQSLGAKDFTISTRHILPNVMHIVLITVVLDFSGLVLAEAVLSYVEIGVDPTMNSWGNMINSARLEMARDPIVWWSLSAAFVFMFTLVLAANLFSDAVRDAFDPRLRGVRA